MIDQLSPDSPVVMTVLGVVLILSVLAVITCVKWRFWNTPYRIGSWTNPYRGSNTDHDS